MSLAGLDVVEAASLAGVLQGVGVEASDVEAGGAGLSLVRFISDVWTVVNALMLGAGLEGGRLRRVSVEYGVVDGLPWARAYLLVDGVLFYLYAKPSIDVFDVDLAVDEAGDAAERLHAEEFVPLVAGYEYTWDAERYAAGINVETIHLGH